MHYYGNRLSENISRREPEGYLLCLNVPVARTGVQEYLPEELGLPGNGPPGLISVQRPESEVFSPETIASFEGMPVTNDHPPDGVDVSNIRALQKGHAHNVRRGTGEESDLLLADLIITDPVLIDLILDGKREISCGYTYELCEENGTYIQRKIRGNHVAVVDAGRAGHRVSIRDHEPAEPAFVIPENKQPERRTSNMKKSLSKILARMAKDGDIETVAEIIEEMIEPEGAETPAEAVAEAVAEVAPVVAAAAAENAEPEAVIETPEATIVARNHTRTAGEESFASRTAREHDEATLGDIISRLDQIISLLTPAAADEDPIEEVAEAVEEALEAVAVAEEPVLAEELSGGIQPEDVAEIVEEILDPGAGEAVSEVLESLGDECGEEEQQVISTGDALRTALKAVKPALARMPKKQRARACADIAARLRKSRGADAGIYTTVAASKRRQARGNPADLGKRIMASRNVNCKDR